MSYYADSSFIVSCFVPDANSIQAKAWLMKSASPIVFTTLHELEVRNAFRLGVFRNQYGATEFDLAWANVEADLHSGRLKKTPVNWRLAFRIASRLSDRHSGNLGARSLDILHVAAAKTLRATDFISFDKRQSALADLAGLRLPLTLP